LPIASRKRLPSACITGSLEWGYGRTENLTNEELIHEKYRGIRPAAVIRPCPDHTEEGTLWRLLDVQANTGMQITESFAMWPGPA